MNSTNRHGAYYWIGLAIGMVLLTLLVARPERPPEMTLVTPTPEPIVPTRTPQPVVESTAIGSATPAAVAPATTVPEVTDASPTPALPLDPALDRIGLAGALSDIEQGIELGLRFGHFTFWRTWPSPPEVPNLTIWQTVRLGQVGEEIEWPAVANLIEQTIEGNPGSYWMVGNEPDVPWQDNATAEEYAEAYHDIYTFIKERDSSAKIGAGGVALPTPLRLAYLDRVLQHYRQTYGEPMPADLWAVHLFVLREEEGGWGIGIPPGMTETAGQLYEVEDHGDIELMKAYAVAFRDWMAANGYGDKPLAVTEFGILLPEDYGFPPEFVQNYLVESFEFFRTATGDSGLAADGGRLVQFAFWYSIYDEGDYKTGNLFDGERGVLTPLGETFIQYVDGLMNAP